jgi:hypothetical protein
MATLGAVSDTTVRPEFGPTLPDLVARRTGRPLARVQAWMLAGLALLAVLGFVAHRVLSEDITHFVQREPLAFNFLYPETLHQQQDKQGGYVRLTNRDDTASFTVRPLKLPPYDGEVSGFLPAYATAYVKQLEQRFPGFEFVEEGKARINEVPGYTVWFRQRRPGKTTRYGRFTLLPELKPGAREGVVLELLQDRSRRIANAQAVATVGVLKQPYRSFRYGTERP